MSVKTVWCRKMFYQVVKTARTMKAVAVLQPIYRIRKKQEGAPPARKKKVLLSYCKRDV